MPGARLERLIRLSDQSRAVAKVEAAGFKFGSIFVVGLDTENPTVSWPRTSRGQLIVECTDDELREEIEALILTEVRREA